MPHSLTTPQLADPAVRHGSRRARRRHRLQLNEQHRSPRRRTRHRKPRTILRSGTRQYERASGDLYELVSHHGAIIHARRVLDGHHATFDADIWRSEQFDLAPSRPTGQDPRVARRPRPHYYVHPHAVSSRRLAMMTDALTDPDAGDLCVCGRRAEDPVHLAVGA